MKKKFISLGLALAMLLGVAGCNITTPATVGSIGGVEIPAGIYLLAQYNAYSTAASNADLATGETSNDVSAVLKADVTGTIEFADGREMAMPGDNVTIKVQLIAPVAMEEQLRFAIREGGRTIGSGVVSKIIK